MFACRTNLYSVLCVLVAFVAVYDVTCIWLKLKATIRYQSQTISETRNTLHNCYVLVILTAYEILRRPELSVCNISSQVKPIKPVRRWNSGGYVCATAGVGLREGDIKTCGHAHVWMRWAVQHQHEHKGKMLCDRAAASIRMVVGSRASAALSCGSDRARCDNTQIASN